MKGVWEILKINFHLAIRNNLIFAAAYLWAVPLLRGIANLDAVRSAECLEQSVILIGIFLIVPLNAPEQPKEIQEVVRTGKIPHWVILLLRLVMAMTAVLVMTAVFCGIMMWKKCTFPFMPYMAGTMISGMALGSIGFLTAVWGNSAVAGYLTAAGYYVLNLLGCISDKSPLYLFSMGLGSYAAKRWLFAASMSAVVIALLYVKKDKEAVRRLCFRRIS